MPIRTRAERERAAGREPGLAPASNETGRRQRAAGLFAQLAEIIRTDTFRLAVAFAGVFALSSLLLFAFIYLQTARHETQRVDAWIGEMAASAVTEPPEELMWTVDTRLSSDLHRLTFAALFDGGGRLLAGNLRQIPPGLPLDGKVHAADSELQIAGSLVVERVRAVAERLPDGRLLVIARNIDELVTLRAIVLRALALGVIPAVLLALDAGLLLSLRALRRVKVLHQTVERIMRGALDERLPIRGTGDDFDRLAASVNGMLDEIGRLLDEIKGVGDDIAHDLRTPLGRVRARLERSRDTARTHAELQEAVDRAIAGLDQALAIITALLRIGEIEAGRRRLGFAEVDLGDIVNEMGDLYAPIAEERDIRFEIAAPFAPPVFGDRDLLIELIANVLGNAIKFTPEGGAVRLDLIGTTAGPVIRVSDTGPGIPPAEREAVLKRFYRSDKSRHVEGSGLGLSLVAAIAKLHGFTIHIGEGTPGCVFQLDCFPGSGAELAFGSAAVPSPLVTPE